MSSTSVADSILERNFPSVAEGSFAADVVFTKINLDSHTQDSVRLRLVRKVHHQFLADEQIILAEHNVKIVEENTKIKVDIDPSRSTLRKWSRKYGKLPLESTIYIQIPSDYSVDLKSTTGALVIGRLGDQLNVDSVSGSVSIEHVEKNASISNVSGKISIGSCMANLNLDTVSGRFTAESIEGDVDLSIVSGSIHVGQIGGNLRSTSTSGKTEIEQVMGNAQIDATSGPIKVLYVGGAAQIENVSGSISLGLPRNTGYDLNFSTLSGRITSDLSIDGQVTRKKVAGTVNGGGQLIALNSVSGSLIVSEVEE